MARGINDEEQEPAGFIVTRDALILRETKGGALVVHFGASCVVSDLVGREGTLPKSVVHAESEAFAAGHGSDRGVLVVKEWFAKKEGWIDGGSTGGVKRGTFFGVSLPERKRT